MAKFVVTEHIPTDVLRGPRYRRSSRFGVPHFSSWYFCISGSFPAHSQRKVISLSFLSCLLLPVQRGFQMHGQVGNLIRLHVHCVMQAVPINRD